MLIEDKARMYKTPASVPARQLVEYDAAANERQDNAVFREVEASHSAFAQRAVRWFLDTQVDTRMAYNHYYYYYYFGKPAAAKPAAKKK